MMARREISPGKPLIVYTRLGREATIFKRPPAPENDTKSGTGARKKQYQQIWGGMTKTATEAVINMHTNHLHYRFSAV
jgi:hypothetical protein